MAKSAVARNQGVESDVDIVVVEGVDAKLNTTGVL